MLLGSRYAAHLKSARRCSIWASLTAAFTCLVMRLRQPLPELLLMSHFDVEATLALFRQADRLEALPRTISFWSSSPPESVAAHAYGVCLFDGPC